MDRYDSLEFLHTRLHIEGCFITTTPGEVKTWRLSYKINLVLKKSKLVLNSLMMRYSNWIIVLYSYDIN